VARLGKKRKDEGRGWRWTGMEKRRCFLNVSVIPSSSLLPSVLHSFHPPLNFPSLPLVNDGLERRAQNDDVEAGV